MLEQLQHGRRPILLVDEARGVAPWFFLLSLSPLRNNEPQEVPRGRDRKSNCVEGVRTLGAPFQNSLTAPLVPLPRDNDPVFPLAPQNYDAHDAP